MGLEADQESSRLMIRAQEMLSHDVPAATARISDIAQFNIIIERHGADGRFIIVNTAEQYIRVYDNNKLIIYEKVIVGKLSTPTGAFSETINEVVLLPDWNLPKGIAQQYFPKMKKVGGWRGYQFYQNGIKVSIKNIKSTDNYRIIQKHSGKSALGDFKFNTKHNTKAIFVHDTPSKYLFNKENRRFSAGCIRMQNPIKLAAFLLNKNKVQIQQILKQNKTKHLPIKNEIPIYIVNWKHWVNPKPL